MHSEKGVQAFEKIKDELEYIEATSYEIKYWNPSLVKSVVENPKRAEFFEKWNDKTITETVSELQFNDQKRIKLGKRLARAFKKIYRK